MHKLHTQCCIAGGGPAGMMLGLLLARAGVSVLVLEKHADFLRDFRGDTVHPSTLQVMQELGLLEALLQRPHQEVKTLKGQVGPRRITLADFSHLPMRAPFIALMPQWDFLDFVAREAQSLPTFELRMQTEVTDLLEDGDRVTGVRARTPDGEHEIFADLVVGADGRDSCVRARSGLSVESLGSAIDVLWLRLSRRADDPEDALGHFSHGHVFVMLDRGDYWQCGFVVPKGGIEALKQAGLGALRRQITRVVPFLSDRVHELSSWDDVHLLTVRMNRLRRWARPGLLCIGDAAHAMSPIAGVGINLAIQDAVATANLLVGPLREGRPSLRSLARVARRRRLPAELTQRMQSFLQDHVIRRVLSEANPRVPLVLRAIDAWPWLRRIPAHLIGFGVRPEHVSEELNALAIRPA